MKRATSPVISVALLTRNGGESLSDVLDVLAEQICSWPHEVVAVDSGSTDGTLEALERAKARVYSIKPSDFRFGPTRQYCFSLTRGKVIVTVSQDAVPIGKDWLQRMVEPILVGQYDIVQGSEQLTSDTCFSWERRGQFYFASPYRHWTGKRPMLLGVCLAISRAAWEQTGFGDVPMSEDLLLAIKADSLGLRVKRPDDLLVAHGHTYTLISLAKRSFNEGMGARFTEGKYSLVQMFRDICRPKLWRWTIALALRREIGSPAEILFFAVRPLMLYIGFQFGRNYWH